MGDVNDATVGAQADGASGSSFAEDDGGVALPLTPSGDTLQPLSRERRPGASTSPSLPSGGAGSSDSGEKRRWRFWEKEKPAPAAAPRTAEKRPRGSSRRASAAPTIEDVWSALGGVAVRSGRHQPLGRCLQWQAPVAGELLDDALKGSIVDRVLLQPVAKGRGRFDALGAILGPPLIVFAIQSQPDRAEVLLPMLRSSIRSSLPLMVPAIRKVQAREAAAAAAAAELFPDLPAGADPVDAILEMMFAGWTPEAPAGSYDQQPTTTPEGANAL